MLPKKDKFTTSDFSNLKQIKTQKIHTSIGFFVILEGSKKGIVLPKKIFKTAVNRNKHKRLFYNTLLETKEFNKTSFIFHPKKVFNKEDLLLAFRGIIGQ